MTAPARASGTVIMMINGSTKLSNWYEKITFNNVYISESIGIYVENKIKNILNFPFYVLPKLNCLGFFLFNDKFDIITI